MEQPLRQRLVPSLVCATVLASCTHRPPTGVSSEHFARADGLALSLDAPSGWRLRPDESGDKLHVLEGDPAAGDPPVQLEIERVSRTTDAANPLDGLFAFAQQSFVAQGAAITVAVPPADALGNHVARGFTARYDADRAVTVFVVDRGAYGFDAVTCIVRGPRDPASACLPALRAVRWR